MGNVLFIVSKKKESKSYAHLSTYKNQANLRKYIYIHLTNTDVYST